MNTAHRPYQSLGGGLLLQRVDHQSVFQLQISIGYVRDECLQVRASEKFECHSHAKLTAIFGFVTFTTQRECLCILTALQKSIRKAFFGIGSERLEFSSLAPDCGGFGETGRPIVAVTGEQQCVRGVAAFANDLITECLCQISIIVRQGNESTNPQTSPLSAGLFEPSQEVLCQFGLFRGETVSDAFLEFFRCQSVALAQFAQILSGLSSSRTLAGASDRLKQYLCSRFIRMGDTCEAEIKSGIWSGGFAECVHSRQQQSLVLRSQSNGHIGDNRSITCRPMFLQDFQQQAQVTDPGELPGSCLFNH